MKIIDLLNEIAKGKVPKKVRFDGDVYTLKKTEFGKEYQHEYSNNIITVLDFSIESLNKEVEVIRDETKRNN